MAPLDQSQVLQTLRSAFSLTTDKEFYRRISCLGLGGFCRWSSGSPACATVAHRAACELITKRTAFDYYARRSTGEDEWSWQFSSGRRSDLYVWRTHQVGNTVFSSSARPGPLLATQRPAPDARARKAAREGLERRSQKAKGKRQKAERRTAYRLLFYMCKRLREFLFRGEVFGSALPPAVRRGFAS